MVGTGGQRGKITARIEQGGAGADTTAQTETNEYLHLTQSLLDFSLLLHGLKEIVNLKRKLVLLRKSWNILNELVNVFERNILAKQTSYDFFHFLSKMVKIFPLVRSFLCCLLVIHIYGVRSLFIRRFVSRGKRSHFECCIRPGCLT